MSLGNVTAETGGKKKSSAKLYAFLTRRNCLIIVPNGILDKMELFFFCYPLRLIFAKIWEVLEKSVFPWSLELFVLINCPFDEEARLRWLIPFFGFIANDMRLCLKSWEVFSTAVSSFDVRSAKESWPFLFHFPLLSEVSFWFEGLQCTFATFNFSAKKTTLNAWNLFMMTCLSMQLDFTKSVHLDLILSIKKIFGQTKPSKIMPKNETSTAFQETAWKLWKFGQTFH